MLMFLEIFIHFRHRDLWSVSTDPVYELFIIDDYVKLFS